jgi:hypothetical protein
VMFEFLLTLFVSLFYATVRLVGCWYVYKIDKIQKQFKR